MLSRLGSVAVAITIAATGSSPAALATRASNHQPLIGVDVANSAQLAQDVSEFGPLPVVRVFCGGVPSWSGIMTRAKASVVVSVKAGCEPVRVTTSARGLVWVTARASDDLLAFSAARLQTDPARALAAIVRVGAAPVALMVAGHGSRIIVADSNKFGPPGAVGDLDVVNAAAAVSGRPAVIGHIPTGQFPREMALEPGGATLLVTNFQSGQLEAVTISGLP